MKLETQREVILKPLQIVSGVVEKRQTLPVLSNVLLTCDTDGATFTATDLELELIAKADIDVLEAGEITLPARKFMDICRALPEGASIQITIEQDRAILKSGKSRFTLSTLPATEFPSLETMHGTLEFQVEQNRLKHLIEGTHFAMAQQDVRYYLNGLLLEMQKDLLRAVATDGHRLALCDMDADIDVSESRQVIVPRKGILELYRLLSDTDELLKIQVGSNHIRINFNGVSFTSKLIDGRFPDYVRVIPQNGDKIVVADREAIRQTLQRTAILSNEKFRGIRLQLQNNLLRVQAHNPEQEEAEEELEVGYAGSELEIGFNVNYVLDALGAMTGSEVEVVFTDSNSSCLMKSMGESRCKYVVMPMRL